jgi:hypothetical protein
MSDLEPLCQAPMSGPTFDWDTQSKARRASSPDPTRAVSIGARWPKTVTRLSGSEPIGSPWLKKMIPMLLDFLTLFFIVAGCFLLW